MPEPISDFLIGESKFIGAQQGDEVRLLAG
jgi:hypothetical protein